jgi:pimeloyl-ACP methyl ester carboxylesterase
MSTLREWYDQGQYFEYKEHRIFYQESAPNRQQALLLLHGFPTSSWDWHRLWEELSLHFHLIAPDFLGFGYSDKPKAHDYRIQEQADIVEALMQAKGRQQYHVLAHDYGDTVAQEILARECEREGTLRLQSLILLNGGLFPETHRPRPIQQLLLGPFGPYLSPFLSRRSLRTNFEKIFGPNTQPRPHEIDEWWSLINYNYGKDIFHKLIQYMAERVEHRERWVNALIDPPILIRLIVGDIDPISGHHAADRYEEVVQKRADVVRLPEIGHYPQTEAPKELLGYCWEFWESL